MQIINFSEHNSAINQYMAELRDKSYQKLLCLQPEKLPLSAEGALEKVSFC